MSLYKCESCQNQYVTEYGIIRCPYCQSKEREPQGEFTLEDINELLLERRELKEKIHDNKR